jgi:hypothetical protein
VTDRDWGRELADALDPLDADRTSTDIEHRLSRIETLLDADLNHLGDAVLGATVARLDARLAELARRVEELLARLEAAAGPPPATPEASFDAPA